MRWEIEQQADGTWTLYRIEANGTRHVLATGLRNLDAGREQLAVVAGAELVRRRALSAATAEEAQGVAWRSPVLIPEGTDTSDGRWINEGAMFWRDPPLPLMLQTVNEGGHYGAVLAGSITTVARSDASVITAEGPLDGSDDGARALEVLTDHERFGISADLGEMDVEWECTATDEEGFCIAERMTVTRGELLGATLTPFPAFADSYAELATTPAATPADTETPAPPAADEEADAEAAAAVIAAGIPVSPPAEWFEDPQLDRPTPMTVEDGGRIYGHAATWDACHIGRADACLIPPRSETDYAHFRVGEVRPEGCDCDAVATGTITLATGHASIQSAHRAAFEHYANSGHAVADVTCGEDEHGIWFAGALRPTVTPEQVRELRGSVISGDWRRIGGNLELIAMLAVNTPGFPVPRATARVASGNPQAMVAVGASPLAARAGTSPESDRISVLEQQVARLSRIAEPLAPQAARALADEIVASATPPA